MSTGDPESGAACTEIPETSEGPPTDVECGEKSEIPLDEDLDSDFGDFGSFEAAASTTNEKTDSGWDAFATTTETPTEGVAQQEASTSQWADFVPDGNSDRVSQSESQVQPQALETCDLERLTFSDNCAPSLEDFDVLPSSVGDDESAPETVCVEPTPLESVLGSESESPRDSSGSMWPLLERMEQTCALTLQWPQCAYSSNLLRCLKVDSNLARLRAARVPVYAAHLATGQRTLQPTKMRPTQHLNSPTEAPRNAEGPTDAAQLNSLAVPPAEFDWKKSGLCNPLTSQSVSNSAAMLDLDMLCGASTNGTGANVRKQLESDLSRLGLDHAAENGAAPKHVKDAALAASVLGVLQPGASSATKGKRSGTVLSVSELSDEARRMHEALPNMDFMLSSVLMFPVRSD